MKPIKPDASPMEILHRHEWTAAEHAHEIERFEVSNRFMADLLMSLKPWEFPHPNNIDELRIYGCLVTAQPKFGDRNIAQAIWKRPTYP